MIGTLKCFRCKNLISADRNRTPKYICKAFPNGIPDEFISDIKPFDSFKECNNGIRYVNPETGLETPPPEGYDFNE